MVRGLITLNFGVLNHPKPKSGSDCKNTGKKIPVKIWSVRFFKIVSNNTKLLDYIEYRVYNRPTFIHMLALLLAFTLAHHNDGNPYGWHMSCERWLQRRIEIQADPNLDLRSKLNLIGYLKSKVEGECTGLYT